MQKEREKTMIELIVVAVVLIVIMLLFVFILFKNIIKSMNENAKKYFVNKLQDYDYILEEKQKTLEDLRSEIEEKEEHNNILKQKEEDIFLNERPMREEQDNSIKYDLNTPEFRETQFFNNYKKVKKIFTVDNEKIIKEFIEKHKNEKEEKKYNSLVKLRNKFDDDAIYQCLTLDKDSQIKIIDESLTATEKNLVKFKDMVENNDRFSIKDLIKCIDEKLEELNPTIYIYTNGLEKRYDLIDKSIVMKQYNNMSEGIIIKYRNKIYDYSI